MAAAVPLSGPNAVAVSKAIKPGTEDWQKEAWYHYDACGEFRAAVTWIANAVSKAEVYAAETDPETGTVTGPTEDLRAQKAAALVLGGLTKRGQLLKTLAVQWQVPGESFIIIRPVAPKNGVPQPDEWMAISGTKVMYKGGGWQYQDPWTLAMVPLKQGTDRLIRIWSPHPNDGAKADSAARPALPILREIEKASQSIAARLDSRIAGNGVYWIPAEMDFPRDEGTSLGQAFSDHLLEVAEAGIQNPGTAAAQVPVVAVVPGEQIAAARHDDLATEFNNTVGELRERALGRLASTLDMPNETAEGSTGGMNHWGSWQVEETTYKIFIEPLLGMLGDAVTHEWFWDVLRAMGESSPERFVLGWETSGIVARPDRQGELKEFWDDVLISDDYRRSQAGIPDDAVPSEDEKRRRELLEMVKVAPTLLADPRIGAELFGFEVAPAAVSVDPGAAEVQAGEEAPALPPAPDGGARPDEEEDVPEGLVAAAELIVYDALSRAGGRLLTREYRGRFQSIPKHELYLSIDQGPSSETLMEGSFVFTDRVAEQLSVDQHRLEATLKGHVWGLLRWRQPYSRDALRRDLRMIK
jgi:hypothetical protein